uniref:(northern house mosquito) hypothetical protein n=1 Tax=Culex pipiens TaxID=7175 RepID=A0A8D8PHP6_CULPI
MCSTVCSSSSSDESVSVGHCVLLMIESSRFVEIPRTSSKHCSWMNSIDLLWRPSGARQVISFGFRHMKACRISSTRSSTNAPSGFMSSGSDLIWTAAGTVAAGLTASWCLAFFFCVGIVVCKANEGYF